MNCVVGVASGGIKFVGGFMTIWQLVRSCSGHTHG